MNVKFLFATLVILLAALTFFHLDAIADSDSASNGHFGIWVSGLVMVLIIVTLIYSLIPSTRKASTFLKEHSSLLLSEDPKVLLQLSEQCDEFLKDRQSVEVERLAQQAKTKGTRIQRVIDFQANLETFKSEISEDGSYPRVVAALKEQMHNPDSFQHVSSEYETVEQDGKPYHKIVMTFRATNTFNALVLQTCYFIVDMDNQVSLVGSPDGTESSPVNTVSLAAAADAAASAVEGAATLADLLLLFGSDE